MGDGYDFTVKIPFTVSLQGEQVDLKKGYTTGGYNYYIESGAYKWYFKPYVAFLKFDSKYYTRDNVQDFDTLQQISSSDIVANMTFDFSGTEPYIKIAGTSYSGTKAVPVSVALYLEEDSDQSSTLKMIDAVRAGFRDYSLIREGSAYGDQYSTAAATALSPVDVTEGSSGNVSFTVSNFWKASTNSSLPTLIEGRYVWDNGADTGTYNMTDASGNSVTVSDVVLILYNGSTTSAAQTVIDSGFTITSSGTSSTVTLPIASLGTTSGKFDSVKMLAVRGTRTEGTGNLTTQPTSFTLHSANYASGSAAVSALTKTVRANETATASYTIPATDLTGTISYIPYNMPSWLNLTTSGNTISYTTGNLQGVTFSRDMAVFAPTAPGTYDVMITATDAGRTTDNTATANITVTVRPASATSGDFSLISGATQQTITLPNTAAITLTPRNARGTVSYSANQSWVTFSGNTATLAPTSPGTYTVIITATDSGRTTNNTATATITLTVNAGEHDFVVSADETNITVGPSGSSTVSQRSASDRQTFRVQ